MPSGVFPLLSGDREPRNATGRVEPLARRDSDGFRYAVRDQLDRLASYGTRRALVVNCIPDTVKGDALLALIDAVGSVSRNWMLSAVQEATNPTYELGGQAAILELFRSMTDVCRWYP
jgi:hypothetical protein